MGSYGRIWYRYIMYINKEDRRSRAIGKGPALYYSIAPATNGP